MRQLLLLTGLLSSLSIAAEPLTIDVHRDANCGCCKAWISHLQANGFNVQDHVESDMPAVKSRLGVPHGLASCHTGVIDGQFVEGHVPASDILKMRQQPQLLGVAVPGMPTGAPGMERGNLQDAYQVIGLDQQGKQQVLSDYPSR